MATQDGFDVELDDLTTFYETVQRAGEDFRDGGLQTLSALSQFAVASGIGSTALMSMARLSSNHMDGQLAASQVLQESFLGLTTLAMGASVIRNSYTSADGQGATALERIDGGVVDKMFAEPKKGEETAGDASDEATIDAQRDAQELLEKQGAENMDALEQGVGQTWNGSTYWIDSYNGSTVVTVPEQGGQPGTVYESPIENELGPDRPEIDKYDKEARYEESNDIRTPELDVP